MKITVGLLLLLSTLQLHARITPADGLWGTADNPAIGSGLMLSTQGGITVASVFTYDNEGQNVWYLASGMVDDNGVFEADLLQAKNGSNILVENPESAEFIVTPRSIKLEFTGSQIGTLSIDGSSPKEMSASHFGFAMNQLIPDLSGMWVIGDVAVKESYILDLEWVDVIQTPGTPLSIVSYQSVHPSTLNWNLSCYGFGEDITAFECIVTRGFDNDLPQLKVEVKDLSTQRMTIFQNNVMPFEEYQAFRLGSTQKMVPNDGYWRPADDPVVGSGLVIRSQGDYTVILMYTYDNEGRAIWQIASGQYDELGKLVTTFNMPTGGSPIESTNPQSATFTALSETLEIQLQGSELASFNINGSPAKHIQNFNFGVPLFTTEHYKVNEASFKFPFQSGQWVMVDSTHGKSTVLTLNEYSDTISPIPATQPKVYDNTLNGMEDRYALVFDCHRVVFDEVISSCTGLGGFASQSQDEDLKIYFQDIGYRKFRMYYGEDMDAINRSSHYYDIYRLDE